VDDIPNLAGCMPDKMDIRLSRQKKEAVPMPTKRKSPDKRISQTSEARPIIDTLRSLRKQVPGFEIPGPRQASLIANAAIPNAFLEAAATTVARSAEVDDASDLDPDETREVIAFSAAFLALAEEAEAFARGVKHAIALRRARVGSAALQVYDVAQGLARRADGKELLPHIAKMKQTLGRSGGKRRSRVQPATTSNKQ
jgi:hypothetical protein